MMIRPMGALAALSALVIGICSQVTQVHAAGAGWTRGHRKVLVIPVRFTDAGGPTNAPDPNGLSGWGDFASGTKQAEISAFFVRQSYNQFTVDFTVLPEVDLGVSTSYYTNSYPGSPYSKWTEWGAPGSLADDARAKARAAGLTNGTPALYASANYDLDIIATGYIAGKMGASSDGGRTVLAHNFNALPHELCHCLGLQHANGLSRPSYYSPVKAGSYFWDTYADVYCLMGYKMNSRTAAPAPDRDVNAYFKYELGWLTTSNIITTSTSGTYRIHAFDQGAVEAGKSYAMRIARDSSYTYWFDFRQAITNFPDAKWSQNGLEVHYGGESPRATSGNTMLLDMTPGSCGYNGTNFAIPGNAYATMHDAPLQLGRTYSDDGADLHITPIKKGGTVPESLDVVVNVGPFPGNLAPVVTLSPTNLTLAAGVPQVFTAMASDPDGDTVTYYWEFDDNTKVGGNEFGGLNADSRLANQGAHAWSQNGVNFVRCTVSDMKGHAITVSATVTVTNGTAAPLVVSGVIRDELGNTLQGAVVNNFKSGVGFGTTNFVGSGATAADGKYQVVIPRSNMTCTLAAEYKGYAFTCSLAGGVVNVASSSVQNVNFTRIRATRTISGGVYVAGRGYDSAMDGALWVSDGAQSVLVSNGGWQMSVADGSTVTLTVTPTNPAYVVSSDFPRPYTVVDDVNLLAFFVDIPGGLPHTGFASSGTNTDDTVGTVAIPVSMTLPGGLTNWSSDQSFNYWIDQSSTAEYGVDYRMHGGIISFYKFINPSPFLIPMTVIRDGVPKNRTVVIRIAPYNSVSSTGPIATYTYTISNPGLVPDSVLIRGLAVSNGMVSFIMTNLTATATNYVLRTHDLVSASWVTGHVFTGVSGQMEWGEAMSNGWQKVFYKIISQ